MALFAYKALNTQGKQEKGTLNAASEKEARAVLQSRGIFPMEVKPSRPLRLSLQSLLSLSREPQLTTQQLAVFTRQFATLLEATIPYDAALEMILQQTNDLTFQSVLADIKGRVVEGAYLADAFAPYPKMFPPMVVNMVRSGESSGTLVLIMHRLADYYENASRLRAKLTSAMVYPAFMMLFGTAVVIFMLTFIIPKITAMFDNFGAQLPLLTRIMIGASVVVTSYWWLILLLIVAAIVTVSRVLKTEKGKFLRDRLELKIPFWKGLRRKMLLQRFTQTLATMLKSGVELKDAMEVSSNVLENKVYLRAMEHVIFDVQNKGLPLSVALRQVGEFPDDLCQMIAIGEETAALDAMLDNVTERLSREVTMTMDGAMALFEPVMIMVMGVAVGFIVIAIMLPMLQLNQLIG